ASMVSSAPVLVCSSPARFDQRPVVTLSRTTTWWPWHSKRRTRCDPMKPAPPASRILMAVVLGCLLEHEPPKRQGALGQRLMQEICRRANRLLTTWLCKAEEFACASHRAPYHFDGSASAGDGRNMLLWISYRSGPWGRSLSVEYELAWRLAG